MTNQLIFLQGGGSDEDYAADAKLVASLQAVLGPQYQIHYPMLGNDGSPDLGRRKQIGHQIAIAEDNVILVGHSFGASMLLAYLSENKVSKSIKGIFLLATPFWQGEEEWVKPFKLKSDFANKIDQAIPIFLYHCRDDEEVPVDQMKQYQEQLPWATFREIAKGGHQFNNDLTLVGNDIRSIA